VLDQLDVGVPLANLEDRLPLWLFDGFDFLDTLSHNHALAFFVLFQLLYLTNHTLRSGGWLLALFAKLDNFCQVVFLL